CGTLRQHVARVVKSLDREEYQRGRVNGRLDRHAVSRIVGNHDFGTVFAKRHMEQGYQTELVVLVDGSGSMGGTKACMAAVLATVVAQAAQSRAVKCEVVMFDSAKGVVGLKAAGEPLGPKPLARLAHTTERCGSSTPLSQSLVE